MSYPKFRKVKKYIVLCISVITVICIQASLSSREPADKAELGKRLFFDPVLSRNRTISCASCHKPTFAFADTSRVSTGIIGRKGTRNTPSSMNMRLQRTFFWDGRAKSLEEQALGPIENPEEMDLPIDQAVKRLQESPFYRNYFRKIFGAEPDRENLAIAIAEFERTLETSDSPFDNWKFSDDPTAVSPAVKRGFDVFNGKGKCVRCHFGSDFTANEFRNIGLFNGRDLNDSGRILVTGIMDDLGKFKTSGLRNVAITSPYMHNGKFKTLREVIDFYNDPGKIVPGSINRDTILAKPLGLTNQEKRDLEAFLRALTDKSFKDRNLKK